MLSQIRRAPACPVSSRSGQLQALGVGAAGGQFDAGLRRQSEDALLREVECADAPVARPLFDRRVEGVVHRRKGQLVQPVGDVALWRDVTGGLAGTHRQAEHGIVVQRHRPGQGGDLAVIHHFQWHAECLADAQEQVADLVEAFIGDAAEQ